MCDQNETCRPGSTGVTPEAFWDVYELAGDGRADGRADDQADDQVERGMGDAPKWCHDFINSHSNPRS